MRVVFGGGGLEEGWQAGGVARGSSIGFVP